MARWCHYLAFRDYIQATFDEAYENRLSCGEYGTHYLVRLSRCRTMKEAGRAPRDMRIKEQGEPQLGAAWSAFWTARGFR